MSNADIKLCFKLIDLEQLKMDSFPVNSYHYWDCQLSRDTIMRVLAALLGQPIEKLAEIRKLI